MEIHRILLYSDIRGNILFHSFEIEYKIHAVHRYGLLETGCLATRCRADNAFRHIEAYLKADTVFFPPSYPVGLLIFSSSLLALPIPYCFFIDSGAGGGGRRKTRFAVSPLLSASFALKN